MSKLYFILSVAGWAWLLVVAVFLVIRFAIVERQTRGFEVAMDPTRPQPETAARNVDGGA